MPPESHPPPISSLTLRFFRHLVRRYFRRHFRSVLGQGIGHLRDTQGPLIVYGNHSSWWDPMLIVFLGEKLLSHRKHYAPMDADSLRRYPILSRIGIFPVELSSRRGAAYFLRTAGAVLREGGVLWLTPQGRFADTREFPLAFRPGLAALALRHPDVPLIPLAVEYTFWDERLPETLMHAGEAFHLKPQSSHAEATAQLEAALAGCMYQLQKAAVQRDASLFTPLFRGGRGTGGMYAVIRALGARLHGKKPQGDHTLRKDDAAA